MLNEKFPLWVKILLTVVYATSVYVCLRSLFRCSASDPGIIPSLTMHNRLPATVKEKPRAGGQYYTLYKTEEELEDTMREQGVPQDDYTAKFYNKSKFKYQPVRKDAAGVTVVPEGNSHNKMSYCKTCAILRPPRAFHCGSCGVCVEVHDHHCPWVGTCIGHRNVRLFIGFLVFTALHALVTFIICLAAFLVNDNAYEDDVKGVIAKGVCAYTGVICLSLLLFATFQVFYLGVRNVASNEDIRRRWNGATPNAEAVKIYADKASCTSRARYYLFGPVPESNLKKYARLIKLHEQIQVLEESSKNAQDSL